MQTRGTERRIALVGDGLNTRLRAEMYQKSDPSAKVVVFGQYDSMPEGLTLINQPTLQNSTEARVLANYLNRERFGIVEILDINAARSGMGNQLTYAYDNPERVVLSPSRRIFQVFDYPAQTAAFARKHNLPYRRSDHRSYYRRTPSEHFEAYVLYDSRNFRTLDFIKSSEVNKEVSGFTIQCTTGFSPVGFETPDLKKKVKDQLLDPLRDALINEPISFQGVIGIAGRYQDEQVWLKTVIPFWDNLGTLLVARRIQQNPITLAGYFKDNSLSTMPITLNREQSVVSYFSIISTGATPVQIAGAFDNIPPSVRIVTEGILQTSQTCESIRKAKLVFVSEGADPLTRADDLKLAMTQVSLNLGGRWTSFKDLRQSLQAGR